MSRTDPAPDQDLEPTGVGERKPASEYNSVGELESDGTQDVYSVFTPFQKRWISYAVCASAMFSGLSSFIYYPAITALSRSLRVSIGLINLTITSYLVVSGVAPSLLGDMADQTGRRPVSLVALNLYFAANVGLALQDSYAALLVLRCVQSAGASGRKCSPWHPLVDFGKTVHPNVKSHHLRNSCHCVWRDFRHCATS